MIFSMVFSMYDLVNNIVNDLVNDLLNDFDKFSKVFTRFHKLITVSDRQSWPIARDAIASKKRNSERLV